MVFVFCALKLKVTKILLLLQAAPLLSLSANTLNAVVYGTMNNGKDGEDGNFIRIFGHGTLSGDLLPHPSFAQPPINDTENWTYHPIDIA